MRGCYTDQLHIRHILKRLLCIAVADSRCEYRLAAAALHRVHGVAAEVVPNLYISFFYHGMIGK